MGRIRGGDGGILAEKDGSGGGGGGQKAPKKVFLTCFEGFDMKS